MNVTYSGVLISLLESKDGLKIFLQISALPLLKFPRRNLYNLFYGLF